MMESGGAKTGAWRKLAGALMAVALCAGASLAVGGRASAASAPPAPPPATPVTLKDGPDTRKIIRLEAGKDSKHPLQTEGLLRWSVVRDTTSGADKPVVVLQAEAMFPDHRGDFRLWLSPNLDTSLSASHIAQIRFVPPSTASVDQVAGLISKTEARLSGQPMIGATAKITSGFFWLAFADPIRGRLKAQWTTQRWIDIPTVFDKDKPAIFTLEKPLAEPAVTEAFNAWSPVKPIP